MRCLTSYKQPLSGYSQKSEQQKSTSDKDPIFDTKSKAKRTQTENHQSIEIFKNLDQNDSNDVKDLQREKLRQNLTIGKRKAAIKPLEREDLIITNAEKEDIIIYLLHIDKEIR